MKKICREIEKHSQNIIHFAEKETMILEIKVNTVSIPTGNNDK